MKTIVLGAGIIGISTAWHLLERGHEVVVVDRQPDAALETSFANAAQISVSYCEPWANREAPLKALKWMFDKEAPLLFRPQLDWDQWRWGLKFLAQCNDTAVLAQRAADCGAGRLQPRGPQKDLVASTGIEYNRLERGIAHFYTDQKSFDAAGHAVELMRKFGVQRRLVSRDELLKLSPPSRPMATRSPAAPTPAPTKAATPACSRKNWPAAVPRGAQFLYGHDVLRLNKIGDAIDSVAVIARNTGAGGQKTSSSRATPLWWPAARTARRCCAPWAWTCPSTPARATAPPSRC